MQIDAAREDHLRHADGQQADNRDLQHHHEQALRAEEKAHAADAPADRLEQDGAAHQDEKDPDVVGQPAWRQWAASLMRST